jgi:hypothetical protein
MSDLNVKNLNLSLKNLKFHEDMSEETPCFSADLYEDGKLIAHVKNEGRGGCNSIYPAGELKYDDVNHVCDIDTDCYIMELAEDLNFVRKNQTKKFVLKKGNDFFTLPIPSEYKSFAQLKKVCNYKQWVKKQTDRMEADGYKVMNTNL